MIKARLESIEFLGAPPIVMQANSVIVIVGPNNSGKSAALASVRDYLKGDSPKPTSLTSLSLFRESSLEEVKTALAPALNSRGQYDTPGFGFGEINVDHWWTEKTPVIGPFLTSQIVCELTTLTRLGDCDAPASFNASNPYHALHPFQKMYRDPSLELKASKIVRAAFKRDLIVHRSAGNTVPVFIGTRPTLAEDEDRLSLSYVQKIERLERIESQGDGVRSFTSIICRVITESRPIQLIDEPEAFLPPPLAKLVAQSILNDSGDRQTILATHSSDVLRGLLVESSDRVSVVRLTRTGDTPNAHHLKPAHIAQLWRDPILRFSNILDGIFHDGVIVTEADADCRFYEAVSAACLTDEEKPDIHYTYSGGKDRLPVVIRSLVALHVPVVTIVDFDVLNNNHPLKSIVEAHQGTWSDIETDWLKVKGAVEQSKAFLDGDRFRREVQGQLATYANDTVVPKDVLKAIRGLTRNASAWDHAKNSGLTAVPTGEPTVAANRLVTALRKLGIFVAPAGEMEGFCRSIGGHGPKWVEAALQRDLAHDLELEGCRTFVRAVNSYLSSRS